ncbi:hypothetical protein BV898_06527 [Hypsibius exemplaris]|uniref:Uncharacterized protein n=1 Tax=Hypsibius exemplaris TaxID=2072580 RepID=A0A1W0WWG2_HYPEX|nr:hypothetical protein BV898_06527 [Hypsibius exemplaris]
MNPAREIPINLAFITPTADPSPTNTHVASAAAAEKTTTTTLHETVVVVTDKTPTVSAPRTESSVEQSSVTVSEHSVDASSRSSEYLEETVVVTSSETTTTTASSTEENRLKRTFTYRADQPGTPPGSLDIEDEMAQPDLLQISASQIRRLSEVAERQTNEAADEERPMSLKERVQFFEQKSQESKSPSPPTRSSPQSETAKSPQTSESSSPPSSVKAVSPTLPHPTGLPPPRGGTTGRIIPKKERSPSPPSDDGPPAPPARQIFASDDEYTADVRVVRDRSPTPPPRRVRVPSPSPPPRETTPTPPGTPPAPPVRQVFEIPASPPPEPPHRQVFEETVVGHESSTTVSGGTTEVLEETVVVRSDSSEIEGESASSPESDTTNEELTEVENIEEDLPSLATEVEVLRVEREEIVSPTGSDSRTSSPESPREGHVRDVIGKIESLIAATVTKGSRRSSKTTKLEGTHYTMETGRVPAVESTERTSESSTEEASGSGDTPMTASFQATREDSDSIHIESDVSHDFDQLAAALSQERADRERHDSESGHLNDSMMTSVAEEPLPESPSRSPIAHIMTSAEEQSAQEYIATRTMRFSVEEETAPQLETSDIQPHILRPITPSPETTVIVEEHGLMSPTVVRSDSQVENVPIVPLDRDDSRLSGSSSTMSAAFMEESMIRTPSPTPTPPVLSPRGEFLESLSSPRTLASVLERPIFGGGMVFPSAGHAEKRHLYLQEKLDRSRPTTPIPPPVPESPRKGQESAVAQQTVVTKIVTEGHTVLTYAESNTGTDINDASSMQVEASDAGTRTPVETTASDDEFRQTSFDSEALEEDSGATPHSDDTKQHVFHKSISFGAGPVGGVASESLLKSLAHASFDNPITTQESFRQQQFTSRSTHSTSGEVSEEVFSNVPEELELHRKISTSSQIADKFGDTENIPRAVEDEKRRGSHVELSSERSASDLATAPEKFVCTFPPPSTEEQSDGQAAAAATEIEPEKFVCHFPPSETLNQSLVSEESVAGDQRRSSETEESGDEPIVGDLSRFNKPRLNSMSEADAYLVRQIEERERQFEEHIHRDLPPQESPLAQEDEAALTAEQVTGHHVNSSNEGSHESLREVIAHEAASVTESISPADMVEGLEQDVLAHQLLSIQEEITHGFHSSEEAYDLAKRKLSAPYISPGTLEELVEEESATDSARQTPHELHADLHVEEGETAQASEELTEIRDIPATLAVHEEPVTVRDLSAPVSPVVSGLVVETAERRLSADVRSEEPVEEPESVHFTESFETVERHTEEPFHLSSVEHSTEVLHHHVDVQEVSAPSDHEADVTVRDSSPTSSGLVIETAERRLSSDSRFDEPIEEPVALEGASKETLAHTAENLVDRAIRASLTEASADESTEVLDEHVEVREVFTPEPELLEERVIVQEITSPESDKSDNIISVTADDIVDEAIRDSVTATNDDGQASEILEEHVDTREVSSPDSSIHVREISPPADLTISEHVTVQTVGDFGTPEAVSHTAQEVVDTAIRKASTGRVSFEESPEPKPVSYSIDTEGVRTPEGVSQTAEEVVQTALQTASTAHIVSLDESSDHRSESVSSPDSITRTAEEVVTHAIQTASLGRVSFEEASSPEPPRQLSYSEESESVDTPEGITRAAEEVVETAIRNAALTGGSTEVYEDDVTPSDVESEHSEDSEFSRTASEVVDTAINDAIRVRSHSIDEQHKKVTFDVEQPEEEAEVEEPVNRFASPEPDEHTTAERFRPKTPEDLVEEAEAVRPESAMSDEADKLEVNRVVKRHVSFDMRAPVQIEDEREDAVDVTEHQLIEDQIKREEKTYVRDVSVSSEEEISSVAGTDETILEREDSPSLDIGEVENVRRTSYGIAASTLSNANSSELTDRVPSHPSSTPYTRAEATVVDEDIDEFAEAEARRIMAAALESEESDGDSSVVGYRVDQNGSPTMTRMSSEVSEEPSVHDEPAERGTAGFGERTITRVTRTTITRSPAGSLTRESEDHAHGEPSSPVTVETVTVRSTRSSVASSPASPQREFPLKTVGDSSQFRSSEDVDASSVTNRTVVRTEVTTLTSTTLEGEVDDSGEQIVTRITRQTITKHPSTLSVEHPSTLSVETEGGLSDTENDDEVGLMSTTSLSPSTPSGQSVQSVALKTAPEPAVTTYTSVGPEVTYETDDQTVVTKVTMTTTVVSHAVSPLTISEDDHHRHHRGGSPSQAQFNTFIAQTLGETAAPDGDLDGRLDVTRTESRTDDMIVRRETQTFTAEPSAEQEIVTTLTRSTVVMHKTPEAESFAIHQAPTIEEILGDEGVTMTATEDEHGRTELATAPERFVCDFPPPSADAILEPSRTASAVDENDSELEELEARDDSHTPDTLERGRGESAQSYLEERQTQHSSGSFPSSSTSMPEISDAVVAEESLGSASGGRGSEISNISASSGRLTSDSSRPSSANSTESDVTLRSPGSRQESSASEYVSALGSPVASLASSYRTAENRQSGSEYDTAATDFSGFSSTPYQTAGEGSTPGSRHLSAVGSPVGQVSDRDEASGDAERGQEALRTSAEIASLAQDVVKEFGEPKAESGTRRQQSWELIGPEDIINVRSASVTKSSDDSSDDFEHVEFEELTKSQALASTMVESTGVVSEPETEKSFEMDDDAAVAEDAAVEVPAATPSQAQTEPDIEYPTTTSASHVFTETASSVVDPHLHHEASDIFDMNHQVPGRRERTPDPTPELPEEKAWTKADFRPGMGMGSRQYSESEFSEAELRDLARRGSEVSIGEVFQRPKSPEPPGSSSPALAESEPAAAVNIHLLVTPEDEETTFLQPLDDILEEKESSSGESDRFQQRRDVVSSASGSLQEFERLEAETSGGGAGGGGGGNGGGPQKPVPHDTESLSSLTEFERLEQQAAVEEEVAFRSPEAESMTHSESMSSGTASTVVEQGRDEDVQSQHTDRDVMGESLDEPEFLHRLSPRQPDIMTDSLDGRSMTESFSMARPRGEQGISDVLMTDSLESEGMRRVLGSNIMADSLVEEELLGHLQGTGEEIQIPPAETVPESKGATVVVRRYLVTGHPTLQTATFTNLDAMQDFLAENQSQYPEMNLQIYESMEEHTDNETEEHDRAVTTTRIVKRRRSDLKESVETVTFTGTDSSHEMAKFLSRTMPLDYNETETVECETRDETGDVTRMMTRRLSRVDTGNAAAAGGALTGRGSGSGSRLLLRQMSSTSSSIPDIPERSPNTDLPPGDAQASHSTGLAALAAHSIDSLRQDVTESSQHEANTETEILEETVVTTVTTDDPSIEEEGAEEIDLTEHDVKEQQKRMEGSR